MSLLAFFGLRRKKTESVKPVVKPKTVMSNNPISGLGKTSSVKNSAASNKNNADFWTDPIVSPLSPISPFYLGEVNRHDVENRKVEKEICSTNNEPHVVEEDKKSIISNDNNTNCATHNSSANIVRDESNERYSSRSYESSSRSYESDNSSDSGSSSCGGGDD